MFDPDRSLARKMVEPHDPAEDGHLIRHLPYVTPVSDGVLMLRDGDLMATFAVDGLGADTAESALVSDVAEATQSVLAQATPELGYYMHRLSCLADPALAAPLYADPFSAAVDYRWQRALRGMGLRERRSFLSVVLRPRRMQGIVSKLIGPGKQAERDRLARRIDRLEEAVRFLMDALSLTRPERLTTGDGRWHGLLRALVVGLYEPMAIPKSFTPIADLIATSDVRFRGDHFFLPGASTDDMRWGAVFSLKDYPAVTAPGILDRLDQDCDSVLTHSFTPIDQVDALARIRRTVRQMSAADDAALSLRGQLIDAADDLASGRISFGNHHASMVIFTRDESALDTLSGQIRASASRAGASMVREEFGARAGYFAQHPGNAAYRGRAAMISSRNFAHFAALHAPARGAGPGEVPWEQPITLLPTLTRSTFRFNFHLGGKPGDRTVGHTLVLGQTGSGKTLTTAFLLAQARRTRARVIVFDKDRGLEMPIRAMGGDYEAVRIGEATGFNPFAAEADERGQAWLVDWLSALLGRDVPLTPTQAQAIKQAVKVNADTDARLRSLSSFRTHLVSTDDDGDLHTRMGDWDAGGGFGWLFAGTGADTLRFRNRHKVTAFDLTEIFDTPPVRTAWLAYVFRRIERLIEDGEPTLIVLDEAWKLLDDEYFERRLKDWMLTMRKKNVAVVLLTQRLAHVSESRAGGSILESAATTLLYPNSRNTPEELGPLALTDREMEFACSSGLGSRIALIRSGDTSVIADMDLSGLGGALRVLGGGGGDWAPPGWREDPMFWKELI